MKFQVIYFVDLLEKYAAAIQGNHIAWAARASATRPRNGYPHKSKGVVTINGGGGGYKTGVLFLGGGGGGASEVSPLQK